MKTLYALCLCGLLCLSAGCGPSSAPAESGRTLSYEGQTVTVPARPARVVTLTTPLLNMAYAVGGTSIARPSTRTPIPPEAESLPELGQTQHIDTEKLLALSPDLVLGEKSQNGKLASLLEGSRIPCLLIRYEGIEDNVPLLKFLGTVYGTEDKAEAVCRDYEARMKAVREKASRHPPARIAVLRATGKDVTAETPASICASMAAYLGMDNVVTAHKEMQVPDKTVPYSLEQLASDDPDILFIVTMGRADAIQDKLDETMRSNPAWSHLKAVRSGRVYFLPYDLFLLNPGLRTPDALEELCGLAYPEN